MLPLFMDGPSGRILVTQYPPVMEPTGRWIIHVPAFAEEMNKSRKIVRDQAEQLAAQGHTVLVADLFSTGDSAGEFSQASWQSWLQDLHYLVDQALKAGASAITLWGLRSGALLAAQVCQTRTEVDRLLLWQPVISGEQFATQFLRLRVAATMMAGQQETVAQLRERSAAGESLEVAGYSLAPALLADLDKAHLNQLAPSHAVAVDWIEVSSRENKPLLPVSQKIVSAWQASGIDVAARVVQADAFWGVQELVTAPALLADTCACYAVETAQLSSASSVTNQPLPESTTSHEHVCLFEHADESLVGVLHRAEPLAQRGVLIVVGGPQYRVGSHRQFVLLARALAQQGIPVFRFDYRGMGDASGVLQGFETAQDDIRAAIDCFFAQQPSLKQVVIWGLCDAASAAAFYVESDSRVAGLVLLNPWVRSEAGEATAFLKHYYLQRLCSKAFWQKVLSGGVDWRQSVQSLLQKVRQSRQADMPDVASANTVDAEPVSSAPVSTLVVKPDLPKRVIGALSTCSLPVLYIMSGNDLTAAEFDDAVKQARKQRAVFGRNTSHRQDLNDADHTFSRQVWRDQVATWTSDWIKTL